MSKEPAKNGHTYVQNIHQAGGMMNASQTGNVYAQQFTVADFEQLSSALADLRSHLRKQDDSVETDEQLGLLAGAQKAAQEKDESKMLACLRQVSPRVWDITKAVVPQVLLHLLKTQGLA